MLDETSMGFTKGWLPIIVTWLHLLGGFFHHYRAFYKIVDPLPDTGIAGGCSVYQFTKRHICSRL